MNTTSQRRNVTTAAKKQTSTRVDILRNKQKTRKQKKVSNETECWTDGKTDSRDDTH